jgi:hypothetical protein
MILLLIVAPGNGRTARGLDDGPLLPGYRIAVLILMSGRQQSEAGHAGFNNQTNKLIIQPRAGYIFFA